MSAPPIRRSGPNHGFLSEIALPDGAHQLCALVTNLLAGGDAQVGCQSVTVHNNPAGTVNPATVVNNTATITGTATDANTTGPVLVRAYRDGSYAGGALTDDSHDFTISIPVAEGSHNVCLYAINYGAGANSLLGCQTGAGAQQPVRRAGFGRPVARRRPGQRLGDRPQHHRPGAGPRLRRQPARRRHLRPTWPVPTSARSTRPRAPTTATPSPCR